VQIVSYFEEAAVTGGAVRGSDTGENFLKENEPITVVYCLHIYLQSVF